MRGIRLRRHWPQSPARMAPKVPRGVRGSKPNTRITAEVLSYKPPP